jgi:hypothetical protein
MGEGRSITIQDANPLLEPSHALPGPRASQAFPQTFARVYGANLSVRADEALPLSTGDRRRSKEGEQNRRILVARERYIQSPPKQSLYFQRLTGRPDRPLVTAMNLSQFPSIRGSRLPMRWDERGCLAPRQSSSLQPSKARGGKGN